MMNAEDAMGLQEDLARIGRRPTPAMEPLPAPDGSGNALAVAIVALRAQQQAEQERHRKHLDDVLSERNEVAALSKAARAMGADEDRVVRKAHELLSRRFDAVLDDSIARRLVLRDVRTMPAEMEKRPWYVPAP